MKKTLFAVLTIATLFANSCTKDSLPETSNQILVRFHNTLDSKIEESRMEFDAINIIDVGEIQAGETTAYIAFDYFEVGYYSGGDYDHPTGNLKGKKDGVAFSAWSGNWCGTGVEYKQLEPGKYTIEIVDAGSDPLGSYWIKFVD
ncbi:MAG: hypothetical protein ACKVU0_12675 [Saprospiraceae bacterium]